MKWIFMMELRRLRVLHYLVRHGTVIATAEALHLTAPAVSQQLAVLEREAGTKLFQKRGRNLVLTPAGQLLASHAEVLLADLATAEASLAALSRNGPGLVRVAAFPSAARTILPGAWVLLHQEGGDAVSIRLREQEPDLALASLLRDDVDIAIVNSYTVLPREVPPRYDTHELTRDPVVLVLHPDDAAANRLTPGGQAPLRRFARHPWLVPTPDLSCYEMIQRACGAAGFVPDVVAQAADFSVLTALVAAKAGVALVPRLALPGDLAGVTVHPLTRPLHRKIFAVTRPGTAQRPDIRRALDVILRSAAMVDVGIPGARTGRGGSR